MIREISVSEASNRLSINTLSVASIIPVSSPSSNRVRNSSGCRIFSRFTSSPTTNVVMRSATALTTSRKGVIKTIQRGSTRAVRRVVNLIGKLTAIVFGVTSPIRSNSGTIIKTLIHPTSWSPNTSNRIEVIFTAEAILTSSLPHRMEMINLRGSSSIAWMLSECSPRSCRSFCRSILLREKRAVSDPEKTADMESNST